MENSGTTWAHNGATKPRNACSTEKSVDGYGWRRRGIKRAYTKIREDENRGERTCCCVATRQISESIEEKD